MMDTKKEFETLKEEIEKLSNAIEEAKEKNIDIKMPDELIAKLKEVADKIDVNELKNKLDEKLPEIKESSQKAVDEIYEFGKKHPVASLIGVFGLGYLIGKIKK